MGAKKKIGTEAEKAAQKEWKRLQRELKRDDAGHRASLDERNRIRDTRIALDPAEHEALLAESELQKKNKRDTQRSDDYAAYEASLDERNRIRDTKIALDPAEHEASLVDRNTQHATYIVENPVEHQASCERY